MRALSILPKNSSTESKSQSISIVLLHSYKKDYTILIKITKPGDEQYPLQHNHFQPSLFLFLENLILT